MRRYASMLYILAAVALTVVIGLLGFIPLALRWLLVLAVFVGLLVLIGRDVTGKMVESTRRGRTTTRFAPGRVDGVLIDLRNKVSLSRLQLVLWTVVVLSAWVTLALHRTIPPCSSTTRLALATYNRTASTGSGSAMALSLIHI